LLNVVNKFKKSFIASDFQLRFRICHQEGQENYVELELDGTHQLLVYFIDVNILDENINNTIRCVRV
jgi:hypothetical protein